MASIPHLKSVETPDEMDAVRALRVRVFVEEQGVSLEEELDGYDNGAFHAMALLDGRVVGTGRLYRTPTGEDQIGRMAVETADRRRGIGSRILAFLEDEARLRGVPHVMLHAQTYVSAFYEVHGYVREGRPFIEAGIEHVRMVKRLR